MKIRCSAWMRIFWFSLLLPLGSALWAQTSVSITLTTPQAGTGVFPDPVQLSAATAGYVNKVEFYAGVLKVGESLVSPYTTQWQPSYPGVYSLTARALDGVNDPVVSEAVSLELLPTLPYTTDFELSEGYSLGAIDGQLGWKINTGSAEVVAGGASHGDNKVVIRGGTEACFLHHEFVPSAAQGICYVDCFVKLATGGEVDSAAQIDAGAAKLSFVSSNAGGRFFVWDGPDGQSSWLPVGAIVPTDSQTSVATSWVRVTLRMDYARKRWDLYLQGKMIAHDLCFADDNLAQFSTVTFKGAAVRDSELDDLYIGGSNPMFTDANNNGVDDAWEQANQLVVDRSHPEADADNDHLSDLDEYIHGTNPHLQDSDGDGLWDGVEVFAGSDPLVADISGPKLPVQGAVLHLRADLGVSTDENGKLLAWKDVSGNQLTCSVDMNAQGPLQVLAVANGYPVARFHNDNDILRLPAMLSGKVAGEIFAAIQFHRRETLPYSQQLWRFGVGDGPSCYFIDADSSSGSSDFGVATAINWQGPGAATYEGIHLVNVSASDGTAIVRLNGAEQARQSGLGAGFSDSPFLGTYLDGDFAEVVIFDHVLSADEREQMTHYLCVKYAPSGVSTLQVPTLTGSLANANGADLRWEAPANQGQYAVAIVERSQGSGEWSSVGTVIGDSSFTDSGLNPGTCYYYRVKLRGLLNTTGYSNVVAVQTSTLAPLSTDGMRLWLRASAGVHQTNQLVKQWDDQSGKGNHARVNDGGAMPVFSMDASGVSSIKFACIGESFQLPSSVFDGLNAAELVLLVRVIPITDHFPWNNDLLQFGNGQALGYYRDQNVFLHYNDFALDHNEFIDPLPESILAEYHILSTSIDAGNWEERINGLLTASHSGEGLSFPQNPSIGGNFSGEVIELLVFDHKLTASERTQLLSLMTYAHPVSSVVPMVTPTLSAEMASPTQVDLLWTNSYNAQEYAVTKVERRLGNGDWTLLASLDNALSYTDAGLPAGSVVSYRVHLENYLGASGLSNTVTMTLPASGSVPTAGLRFWYRGSVCELKTNSDRVLRWNDQSGKGNDAYVCSSDNAAQFKQDSASAVDYLSFDGSNQGYVIHNPFSDFTAGELILVSRVRPKLASLPSNNDLLQFGCGQATGYSIDENGSHYYNDFGLDHNEYPAKVSDEVLGAWNVMDCAVGGGVWQERMNGRLTLKTAESQTCFPGDALLGNSLDGDVAELLCFDHVLSEAERMSLLSYLKQKYSITQITTPSKLVLGLGQGTGTSIYVSFISEDDVACYNQKILERSTDGTNFVQVAVLAPGESYCDNTVQAGLRYYYRAHAVSAGGSGDLSDVVSLVVGTMAGASANDGTLVLSADQHAGFQAGQFVWMSQDLASQFTQASQDSLPSLALSSSGAVAVHSDGNARVELSGVSLPGDFEIVLLAKLTLSPADFGANSYMSVGNSKLGYERLNGVLHSVSPWNTEHDQVLGASDESQLGKTHLLDIVCSNGVITEYVNGVARTSYNRTSAQGDAALVLFDPSYVGDLYEVMIHSSVLTDAKRSSLYDQLAQQHASDWTNKAVPTLETSQDSDGDGVSDKDEQINGTNPFDYYNGSSAQLGLMTASSFYYTSTGLQPSPVVFRVVGSDGLVMINAPVQISCSDGAMAVIGSTTSSSLSLRSDSNGDISFYVQISDLGQSSVQVSARLLGPNQSTSQSVTYTKYVAQVPPTTNGGDTGSGTTVLIDGTIFGMAYLPHADGKMPYIGYGVINMTQLAATSNVKLGWSFVGMSSDGYVLYGARGFESAGQVFSPKTGGFTIVPAVDEGAPLQDDDGSLFYGWWPDTMTNIRKGGLAIGWYYNNDSCYPVHYDGGVIFCADGKISDVTGLHVEDSPIKYPLRHLVTSGGRTYVDTSSVDEYEGNGFIYSDSGSALAEHSNTVDIPDFYDIKAATYSKTLYLPMPVGVPSLMGRIYDGNVHPSSDTIAVKQKNSCKFICSAGDMGTYIVKAKDAQGNAQHYVIAGWINSDAGIWTPLAHPAAAINYSNQGYYICAAPNSNMICNVNHPDVTYATTDLLSTGFEQITPNGLLVGTDAEKALSLFVLKDGSFSKFQVYVSLPDGGGSFQHHAASSPSKYWLSDDGWIAGTVQTASGTYEALAIPMGLYVDCNRDGVITLEDQVSKDSPYRFWINDDNDSGNIGGDDIPLKLGESGRNCDDDHVNGARDLVDFFPVYLDIKQLLNVLPATTVGVKYKLKQANGALNFVYTNKTLAQAFDYQKQILGDGFGPDFTQPASAATTQPITAEGVELSVAFLNLIQNKDGGVILVEGSNATTSPLVLSVEKDNVVIAEVKLELSIGSVEDMFRHVDLTGVPKGYDGSTLTLPKTPKKFPAPANEPANYPDSLTNGKYFIFVHGYNVDADKARGWNAEMFKRLYVLGSRARFVGVNWHGATGLDYHKAVYNAFQTGEVLAGNLAFIPQTADVTVAAHSLGNMVVSHAIQSGGFTPSRYFMINAAVPIEAYAPGDVTPNQIGEMTEQAWRAYDQRLYSANWHDLFKDTDDKRQNLTWKNRFNKVVYKAYNFYSPGEDVVANASDVTSASVLDALLNQGLDSLSNGTNSWKIQELAKGVSFVSSAASVAFERQQGGWGFNEAWYVLDYPSGPPSHVGPPILHIREPSQTSSILSDTTVLKASPFSRLFLEADLLNTDASVGSAKAGEIKVQYDVLACGIPAMSNAAAANELPSLGEDHNINMPENCVAKDPITKNVLQLPNDSGKWRHSDIKVMPLEYIYPMFQKMIDLGGLK